MKVVRLSCFLGVISLALGLLTIWISTLVNPWFDVMGGALSDMGRVGLPTSWVFNDGLLTASLIAATYAYCLTKSFRHPASHVAAGIYLVSVTHLTLIALFPEGTIPHLTLSFEFFLMMMFTYLTYSITLWVEGLRTYSILSFLAFATALGGSAGIKWPSTALLELFNVGVMAYWYVMMFQLTNRLLKNPSSSN